MEKIRTIFETFIFFVKFQQVLTHLGTIQPFEYLTICDQNIIELVRISFLQLLRFQKFFPPEKCELLLFGFSEIC